MRRSGPCRSSCSPSTSRPQHIEGEAAGCRTVILEFESEADFRTWYDSPEYQAIIGKRHAATTGFAILAQGA